MRRVRDLGEEEILEVWLRGDGGLGFGKGDGRKGWGSRRIWEKAKVPSWLLAHIGGLCPATGASSLSMAYSLTLESPGEKWQVP